MKKIWLYLSLFLAGLASGLVLMYKLTGEQIKVTVKKIKNKGTSGANTVTIPVNISSSSRKETRRSKRVDKKAAREAIRIAKRIAKAK